MCGISGIIHFNNQSIDKKSIETINNALSHRGPDNEGYWFNDDCTVAFGHRRLSIIDLSSSASLPMQYINRYWITYNGEIFNFIELKEELVLLGHFFSNDSDTEVLLAAYHQWGKNMLQRLNGMWAFAIYDLKTSEIFISRDRFGIKPLYYYQDENKFVFASEVQALHKYLGNSHDLDKDVIENIVKGQFLSFGTERTYLDNVNSLPGGFSITIENNNINKERWYKVPKIKIHKKYIEQVKELRKLIFDAVNIRMRSDVSVGTCLSGGIDSGSITSVINEIEKKSSQSLKNFSHKAYCASFPNTPIDESKDAALLASMKNVALDVYRNNCPSIEELEKAMDACDGPMHALAFFPIYKLYEHIKQDGITVTLDGQGPDEMLGGYNPLNEALSAAWEMKNPAWFIDVYRTYSAQGETKQSSSKIRSKNLVKNFIRIKFLQIPKNMLYSLGIYKFPITKKQILEVLSVNKPNKEWNSLDKSLFNQFFNAPLPAILQQYDRCSMANSVECRMPFMDYRIVEFIFNLPVGSKVGKGYTKRILRDAMKGILPDQIRLNKTKIGFNAPIVDWFQGGLKDWMLSQMEQKEFLQNKFFEGEKLAQAFKLFLNEKNPQWNDAWQFWPPVHLAWWMRKNSIRLNNL